MYCVLNPDLMDGPMHLFPVLTTLLTSSIWSKSHDSLGRR